MKTLVIHPDDRSTDFLRPIYQNIPGATIITKNIAAHTLRDVIRVNEQIIMLGHGSPSGLFNVSDIGSGLFAIGSQHADILRDKKCVYIWCNADQFVRTHNLPGLYTGMFISEVAEADYCQVLTEQKQVDDSNNLFAELLGKQLVNSPTDYEAIHLAIKDEYGVLATDNAVAKYNWDRWYVNTYSKIFGDLIER